jgi:hypothetical protein
MTMPRSTAATAAMAILINNMAATSGHLDAKLM